MKNSGASHPNLLKPTFSFLPPLPSSSSSSGIVIKPNAEGSVDAVGSESFSSSRVHADVRKVDHVFATRAYYAMLRATNDCSARATNSANVTYKDSLPHIKQVGIPSIRVSTGSFSLAPEFLSESRVSAVRKLFNLCTTTKARNSPPIGVSAEGWRIDVEFCEVKKVNENKNPISKSLDNQSISFIRKCSNLRDHCFSSNEFHSFLRECGEKRKFRLLPNLLTNILFRRNPVIIVANCESSRGISSDNSGNIKDSIIIIPQPSSSDDNSKEANQKQKDSLKQSSTPTLPSSGNLTQGRTLIPESKMKEERQLEFILKSLVAGGVAGMCAKTAVAPLDRMKILLQAHSKHYSHLGVFSGLRGIVQKESLLALYKGNGAQMVRIFPYAATQFTSFEQYKKLFGEKSHIARFAAGSCAGVTAVALTYPLDTIRARLAFQVTGEHVYSGIYNCGLHIFREEGGIRALYRGFIPTVCGMIPYAGLSFYCFESFKYLCMKYLPTYTCKSHSTNTGGLVLLLYAKLICGGVAGAVAQTVSYPMDVTRRRMQLAMMDEKTKKFGMGMLSTIKLIYQENGVVRGLYRGMSINYLRAIPMVAVSFSTYELVKQTLNLDTGIPIKTG